MTSWESSRTHRAPPRPAGLGQRRPAGGDGGQVEEAIARTGDGEDAVVLEGARRLRRRHPGVSQGASAPVGVQLDAHGDLGTPSEGSQYNHACILRRVAEERIPTLQVGIGACRRRKPVHPGAPAGGRAGPGVHEAPGDGPPGVDRLTDEIYLRSTSISSIGHHAWNGPPSRAGRAGTRRWTSPGALPAEELVGFD